jgi:GNAT superfamily N-acetyltransferase
MPCGGVKGYPRNFSYLPEISKLFVKEEYRGQGIAGKLTGRIEKEFKGTIYSASGFLPERTVIPKRPAAAGLKVYTKQRIVFYIVGF